MHFISVHAASNNTSRYNLYYKENSGESYLHVDMLSYVNEKGLFELTLPPASTNITLHGESNISANMDQSTNACLIKQAPNAEFVLSYDYIFKNHYRNVKKPIIENDFFYFNMGSILPFAEHTVNEPWVIYLDIKNIPSDFSVFSSWPHHDGMISFTGDISTFSRSVLWGTKEKIKHIYIKESPTSIYTEGEWRWLDKPPIDYIQHLIKFQRQFWEDNYFPNYSIVFLEDTEKAIGSGFQGVHFQNAFIAKASRPTKQNKSRYIIGLSHELFHAWIGYKIKLPSGANDIHWFLEGFTNYYGFRLALQSGSISFSEYIEALNEMIRLYHSIPMNRLPYSDVIKGISYEEYFYQLSMLRGHFLALKIATHMDSTGKKRLDDVMHEILKDAKDKDLYYSENDIKKIFEKYLGEFDFAQYISDLKNGELLSVPEKGLGSCVDLTLEEVKVPDFGFDMLSLFEKREISKININSPAYKAGLRNGMNVLAHEIGLIVPERPVVLHIAPTNKDMPIIKIEFTPESRQQSFPQYKLKKKIKNRLSCVKKIH